MRPGSLNSVSKYLDTISASTSIGYVNILLFNLSILLLILIRSSLSSALKKPS